MKTISSEQKELIDALVAQGLAGNLSAAVLEKDVHVTDALRALATLRHPNVRWGALQSKLPGVAAKTGLILCASRSL